MNKLLLAVFLSGINFISLAQSDTIQPAKIPFEGMDLTWINGQNRQKDFPLVLTDKNGLTILTEDRITLAVNFRL